MDTEKAIQALQRGMGLTDSICNDAIMAACALEQRYSGHTPAWQTDYPPFEFCMDMDALRETLLTHSGRFIDVANWSTTHDFRPLDEIAAIRHEEKDMPEHKQSSPLYLLAIEMRNPWVVADDAQLDIEKSLGANMLSFLRSLLYQWPSIFPFQDRLLDNALSSIRGSIDELLSLSGHPFTALTLAFAEMINNRNHALQSS